MGCDTDRSLDRYDVSMSDASTADWSVQKTALPVIEKDVLPFVMSVLLV